MSLVLASRVIENDLKRQPDERKMISQIIYVKNKYVKVYVEGYLDAEGNMAIKMSGICEDD